MAKHVPVKFPRGTTLSIDPGEFRDALNALTQFGALTGKALRAAAECKVDVDLQSETPGAVDRAKAAIAQELKAMGVTSFKDALPKLGAISDTLVYYMREEGVTVVLQSSEADGVANAVEILQKELIGTALYGFAEHFIHAADNLRKDKKGRPETDGCTFPKFF
jgi:hypothetical protein